MTKIKKFSILEAKKLFKGPWDPKDLVEFSRLVLRVAQFKGKYLNDKHTHDYDEFFLVLEGKIEIDTILGKFKLSSFDGIIIPAGIPHQPFAKKSALVLMLDRKE